MWERAAEVITGRRRHREAAQPRRRPAPRRRAHHLGDAGVRRRAADHAGVRRHQQHAACRRWPGRWRRPSIAETLEAASRLRFRDFLIVVLIVNRPRAVPRQLALHPLAGRQGRPHPELQELERGDGARPVDHQRRHGVLLLGRRRRVGAGRCRSDRDGHRPRSTSSGWRRPARSSTAASSASARPTRSTTTPTAEQVERIRQGLSRLHEPADDRPQRHAPLQQPGSLDAHRHAGGAQRHGRTARPLGRQHRALVLRGAAGRPRSAPADVPAALRVGLLGCGRLGSEVMLPLLAGRPDVRVTVVADPDETARARARARVPAARADADWRDGACLRRPRRGGRDAADGAPRRRPPWRPSRAGSPMYLEKPLASTLEEATAVREAWRATGLTARRRVQLAVPSPAHADAAAGARRAHRRATRGALRVHGRGPLRRLVAPPRGRGRRRAVRSGIAPRGPGALSSRARDSCASARRAWPPPTARRSPSPARLDGGVVLSATWASGTIDDDVVEVVGTEGAIRLSRYEDLTLTHRGRSVPGAADAADARRADARGGGLRPGQAALRRGTTRRLRRRSTTSSRPRTRQDGGRAWRRRGLAQRASHRRHCRGRRTGRAVAL